MCFIERKLFFVCQFRKFRGQTPVKNSQFLNVLKGDMSLVGTRQPLVGEVSEYELHHRARLSIKLEKIKNRIEKRIT